MRDETVARSYAGTLVELAERHEGIGPFGEAAALLAEVLDSNADFRLFLETPRVPLDAKKETVRKALGGRVPTGFLNFVQVVLDKRRQRLLRTIAGEYAALVDEREGRKHARLTVARPLDPETKAAIDQALEPVLGGTVVSHEQVDPRILGGIVVRSGDRVWDGSVRRRLEAMRRSLLHVELPEMNEGPTETAEPAG